VYVRRSTADLFGLLLGAAAAYGFGAAENLAVVGGSGRRPAR
jgi:hypothetical protein